MKNMHWTNRSMHLHDETWNHHQYILNGSWCTSTTTTATTSPPNTSLHYTHREHRYILVQTTQSPAVVFHGALQQLQMLLHVQWSISRMSICPTSRPVFVVWNHRVLLCYIKAWGLFLWSAVDGEVAVHVPLFIFTFDFFFVFWKRGPCWQGFSSMSILCGSIPEENTQR